MFESPLLMAAKKTRSAIEPNLEHLPRHIEHDQIRQSIAIELSLIHI